MPRATDSVAQDGETKLLRPKAFSSRTRPPKMTRNAPIMPMVRGKPDSSSRKMEGASSPLPDQPAEVSLSSCLSVVTSLLDMGLQPHPLRGKGNCELRIAKCKMQNAN